MRRLQYVVLILLCSWGLSAARGQAEPNRCLRFNLWNDSHRQLSPDTVEFIDGTKQVSVHQSDGKYCLPEQWESTKTLDITFEIGRNRLYLTQISTDRFFSIWTVSYGLSVNKRLPGHSTDKKLSACAIDFNEGEPGVGVLINPCVLPRRMARKP